MSPPSARPNLNLHYPGGRYATNPILVTPRDNISPMSHVTQGSFSTQQVVVSLGYPEAFVKLSNLALVAARLSTQHGFSHVLPVQNRQLATLDDFVVPTR